MNAEDIRERLASGRPWERRADGWWLEAPELDVEGMARLMVEAQGRLVTITGSRGAVEECRLLYHWDLDGELLTLATVTRRGSIPGIAALCPAADWIEREIHDYFAVSFSGREELRPLVLRPGDAPGLFNRNGGKGGER